VLKIHHPIFMDEITEGLDVILRAVGESVCDASGLKETRMGGLSAMRTIRDICRTPSLPITCDDAWGGDIISAACTHIATTVNPRLLDRVWLAAPHIDGHYDPENGIGIKNGHILVPKGTGLGVQPDKSLWGEPVMPFC
jgi:L-alanine-DL-glutamate epimerase-like enolase superfamily enzyme